MSSCWISTGTQQWSYRPQTGPTELDRLVTFMCTGHHCTLCVGPYRVCVCRFVCRGTVEERIQLLQNKKLQLSASVLSGLVSLSLSLSLSHTHTSLIMFLPLQSLQAQTLEQTNSSRPEGSLPS